MVDRRSWIVVADRRLARFYRHAAPGEGLTEADPGALEFEAAAETSDRPGRVHERVGGARHAMEAPTPASDLERDRAARAIAKALQEGAQQDRYARLVIAAAPDLIGAIRGHLDEGARARLVGEIGHRWIDLPQAQLAARLTDEGIIGRVAG